ncbi:MAG: type I glutamate--ammonia ligase, partial [Candidatus Limosilactobacillus intestinavium]
SLSEAIDDLNNDEVITKALGSYFVDKFTELKQQEIDAYRTNVTDWEHKEYFDD